MSEVSTGIASAAFLASASVFSLCWCRLGGMGVYPDGAERPFKRGVLSLGDVSASIMMGQ